MSAGAHNWAGLSWLNAPDKQVLCVLGGSNGENWILKRKCVVMDCHYIAGKGGTFLDRLE